MDANGTVGIQRTRESFPRRIPQSARQQIDREAILEVPGRIISLEAYDDLNQRSSRKSSRSLEASTERGRALRAQLINRGIDRDVLAVLDITLSVGRQGYSF
ncbi:hypothetical protein V8C42DRAFT_95084 [Trichoderma barbatum]